MERVVNFLKEAETYYLATVEGDQPRVRPFGTAHVFEGKLYIQTGKVKDVSKQIHANPKVEICAFKNGEWLRVAGELVEDDEEKQDSLCLMLIHLYRIRTQQMMEIQRYSILRMQQLHFHHLHMNRNNTICGNKKRS